MLVLGSSYEYLIATHKSALHKNTSFHCITVANTYSVHRSYNANKTRWVVSYELSTVTIDLNDFSVDNPSTSLNGM